MPWMMASTAMGIDGVDVGAAVIGNAAEGTTAGAVGGFCVAVGRSVGELRATGVRVAKIPLKKARGSAGIGNAVGRPDWTMTSRATATAPESTASTSARLASVEKRRRSR